MPKQSLGGEDKYLQRMMIETFMAGCQGAWPKSTSDLEWGIRALMKMFDCRRLPLARELEYEEDDPKRTEGSK